MWKPSKRIGGPIGLGLAVLGAWLVGSCSETPTDVLIPNTAPRVAISAGPIRDSVDVFIVSINWNASDSDGQVERFLYAIDDTLSPGAWFETPRYEITLFLTATVQAGVDSIRIGSAFLERYRFRDAHTFYLKAVDDDGALSPTAALSFTAETFAPETEILIPDTREIISLGRTFTVTWRGTDLDGTENPVGYSFRLVRVPNVVSMTPAEVESTLYDPASPGEPWSSFSPRTSVVLSELEIPAEYLFGVVALDQAGAVEPRLRTAQVPGPTNVLRIRAEATGGRPRLVVSSSVKTLSFPNFDETRNVFQIPANRNVTMTWEAFASHYGGRVASYSWGIDLLDPEAESPEDPGWAPASAALTRAVLRFDLPPGSLGEDHFLYVRARDDVGSSTIARILLIVVPLSLERDVLLVDDFAGPDDRGNAPPDCVHSLPLCSQSPPPCINPVADFPQDYCHDQFLREALERGLAAIGHPEWVVDLYEPLDSNGNVILRDVIIDRETLPYWVYTGPVTLENLARYKLVLWNVKSESNCMLQFMNLEGNDNFLAVFVEAGGKVWIQGTGSFSRTVDQNRQPFGFEPADFLYRFHKFESVFDGPVDCVEGCFRGSGQTSNSQRLHGFDGAYASQLAISEGYPDTIRVSRPPFSTPGPASKGIPGTEGMVRPFGLDINPRLRLFGGQLDTLYFFESNGRLQGPPGTPPSFLDDAATALRYSGPGQGRMMDWGFPLYFLPDDVDQLIRSSLDWFLEVP